MDRAIVDRCRLNSCFRTADIFHQCVNAADAFYRLAKITLDISRQCRQVKRRKFSRCAFDPITFFNIIVKEVIFQTCLQARILWRRCCFGCQVCPHRQIIHQWRIEPNNRQPNQLESDKRYNAFIDIQGFDHAGGNTPQIEQRKTKWRRQE